MHSSSGVITGGFVGLKQSLQVRWSSVLQSLEYVGGHVGIPAYF